jgi:hypothetical protein
MQVALRQAFSVVFCFSLPVILFSITYAVGLTLSTICHQLGLDV